jgi:hypothetical protein
MKKSFNPSNSPMPTHLQAQQPIETAVTKKSGRKNLYITLSAIVAIIIIVTTIMFVPQGTANVISLGVNYSVGEKLTYDVTSKMSLNSGAASADISTNYTVTVEVLSFNNDIYKLNYTTSLTILGMPINLTNTVEVKANQMVTALALLPVAAQQYASNPNGNSPLMTAFFDQSQAKVGDTWTLPLSSTDSSQQAGNLTVTFKAIQDLKVDSRTYKVFKMDYTTNFAQLDVNMTLSGQAFIQTGSCKQIQSNLQLTTSTQLGSVSYSYTYTITTTLTQDQNP